MLVRRKNLVYIEISGHMVMTDEMAPKDTIDHNTMVVMDLKARQLVTEIRENTARGVQHKDIDIIIHIDSVGGSARGYYLFAATLKACKEKGCRVITLVNTKACSAAAGLFSEGDIRFMSPDAYIMLHEVSVVFKKQVSHSSEQLREQAGYLDEASKKFLKKVAKNLGISAKLARQRCAGRDWYIHADEAKKLGICQIELF